MILRCAEGLSNKAVAAEEIGVNAHTVGKWRRRFVKDRLDGLSDEPRSGRPRTVGDERVTQAIERTLTTTPTDATHWSLCSMAREAGLARRSHWHVHFTPASVPSSTGTTKTPCPSSGPNQSMTSLPPSNASASALIETYVTNFRFR